MHKTFYKRAIPNFQFQPSLYLVLHVLKVEELFPLVLVDGVEAAAEGAPPGQLRPPTELHLAVVAEVLGLLDGGRGRQGLLFVARHL